MSPINIPRVKHSFLMAKSILFFLFLSFGLDFMILADERTQTIQSIILDSFDDETNITISQGVSRTWEVAGSTFKTEGYPIKKYLQVSPDVLGEREKVQALGIQGKFNKQGYNYIELIPVEKTADGNTKESPFSVKGRVLAFDLWVWGSNFNYYMEIHVRDTGGVDHILNLGDLKFSGWKRLTVDVPLSIPQSQVQLPRLQELKVTKIMIWTQPRERVDDFKIYIDEFSVLTDTYESRYDGFGLVATDFVQQTWGGQ